MMKTYKDDYICAVCGKNFYALNMTDWAYKAYGKKRTYPCCSWSCLRKMNIILWNDPRGRVVDYDAIATGIDNSHKTRQARKRHGRVETNY